MYLNRLVIGVVSFSMLMAGCIAKVEKKIPVYLDSAGEDLPSGQDTTDLDASEADIQELELGPETSSEVEQELVPVESVTVGTEGGSFLLEGGVELVIPPGAVAGDAVTIEALAVPAALPPEGLEPITAIWTMEPSGTTFAKPIVVGLPRLPGDVAAEKWPKLKGYVGDADTFDDAELVPAWAGPDDTVVYIRTNHFSLVVAGFGEVSTGPVCGEVELCNGLDDDCDGTTDEDVDVSTAPCLTLGVCQGAVVATCLEGAWQCDYSLVEDYEQFEESCDGKDNDCDGSVDEALFGQVGVDLPDEICPTQGVCSTTKPDAVCAAGAWYCDFRSVDGYQGVLEFACDGKDNNCDGTVDEATCQGFEPCTDNDVCVSGLCVKPLGEATAKFCTFHPASCLVKEGEVLSEVGNEATTCVGDTSVAICQSGLWSPSSECSQAFPGTFKCLPDTGACTSGCEFDEDCIDDGDKCNGVPHCVDGECELNQASVVVCPGTDCLMPVCDPATGLCSTTFKNESGPCDDGDKCTVVGMCVTGVCTGQNPVDCNDQNPCTVDSCDEETGACINDPAPMVNTQCDDGFNCTLDDKCSPTGVCQGTTNSCDDENQCTADSCLEATGLCSNVSSVMEGVGCEDNNGCTLNDTCLSGQCLGLPKQCADTNDCTTDSCDTITGDCVATPIQVGSNCAYPNNSPGALNPCTPNGVCDQDGVCQPGADLCECRNDADCEVQDNGNLCDGIYRCNLLVTPYQCYYDGTTVITCPTENDTQCTKDVCAPETGVCSLGPVIDGTSCDDGDLCTQTDKCLSGQCTDSTPVLCDDLDPCTNNECIPESGCSYPFADAGTLCEDGDPCTLLDECDGAGACTPGAPKDPACDDSNICTADTCTPDGTGCLFEPISGCCLLDEECAPDVCFNNACCTPNCTDKVCGDDGCGGSCGGCEAWEECVDGACECPTCCASSNDCNIDQVCPLADPIPVCADKARIYHRGFEGEPAGVSGTLPDGILFTYSSSSNPWKVRNFTDGSNCNSGTYVLQYSKSGSLNASGDLSIFYFVPSPAQSTTRVFSFYLKCVTSPDWALEVRVNDTNKLTLSDDQSCSGDYVRHDIPLDETVSGLTKFTFSMNKIAINPLVTVYIDDIALYADDCVSASCTTFTKVDGVCKSGVPTAGNCYLDGTCWDADDISPVFKCLRCVPANNPLVWAEESGLCDVGQTCDPSYAPDGCKTL